MPVRPTGETKLELVRECLKPGVSVAKMALRHGINANLLRKWITKSFDRSEVGTPPGGTMKVLQAPDAFVPVRIEPSELPTTATTAAGLSQGQSSHRPEPALMRLQVRLPNGVTVDLGEAGLNELSPAISTSMTPSLLTALSGSGEGTVHTILQDVRNQFKVSSPRA